MLNNPYAKYANNKVTMASPAELTLMLYEGAIKFCNMAILGIEEGSIQKAHDNIIKAERIIRELSVTLNRKYPVAKDFDTIYNYLIRRLHEANIKKDKAILEEINTHLRSVRDTWKQVMQKCRTGEVDESEAQYKV